MRLLFLVSARPGSANCILICIFGEVSDLPARHSLIFALSACLGGSLLPAQTAPKQIEPHKPVIRTNATEVLLDVVVRDKHRKAIRDLKPSEIQVYEDGVPQKIKAFRDVEGADQLQSERKAAHTKAALAPEEDSVEPRNRLQQVNFVSVVLAQIAPQNLNFAREAVLQFLKNDDLPNTYLTLFRLNRGLQLVRPYTDNKELLAQAVDSASTGLFSKGGIDGPALVASAGKAALLAQTENIVASPITGPATINAVENAQMNPLSSLMLDPNWSRNASSQDASTNIGNALITQADMAKGLRFATSLANGMNAMDSLRALVHSQEKLPGRKVVLYLADGLQFPVNRREVVDSLISYANRSGVTFYTIDTKGLNTEDPMAESLNNLERVGAESSAQRADPRNGHKQEDDEELTAVSNDQLALRELAEATGGFAVASTNQIAEPMQRMMEDMRTHYELAYTPTSTLYDGHFRKIDVKVARRKVTVQTRRGYYAIPELNGEPLQPFEVVALNEINADPAPVSFPYQAALMSFRPQAHEIEYELTFEVPISSFKVVPESAGKGRIQASLVALIHNEHGEVVSKVSREVTREVVTNQVASHDRILYAEPVRLPAGNYEVVTAVTDEQSGRATVKRSHVAVNPGETIKLSSVQVVGKVEPLAGPRNPANPFELDKVRIMPTLAGSVDGDKPVAVYFVVYPGVAELDPKVTLQLFQDGKEIARKPLALPKPEPDGSIPMLVKVSPGRGQCDIRITARQGELVAKADRSVTIQ